MKITGTLIEIGEIAGCGSGLVIDRDGETIDIIGLTVDELRAMPNLLYRPIVVTVEQAEPAQ